MEKIKFKEIAESLRQYRRAELKDYIDEVGENPVDKIYVDPLQGDAVLQSVLSSNTTFLLGRKGTGKSTVFTKAQLQLRKKKNVITLYLDVKSLYDTFPTQEVINNFEKIDGISESTFRAHILRKSVLGKVISELLKEIDATSENMSLIKKWTGEKKRYDELKLNLKDIQKRLKHTKLESHEIPILQKISTQTRTKQQIESSQTSNTMASAKGEISNKSLPTLRASVDASLTDFDKSLDDIDIYNEYSDVVYRSFPFSEIIEEIQDLLEECELSKLVIFLDDFSELNIMDQRLFVDVILSPLNNSSNETIKLKIAGYPGRVYFGKIDPNKVDTLSLDFSDLYESTEVQEMERNAIDYTTRLLQTRFTAFNVNIEDYFDTSTHGMEDYYKLFFQASFNVPRIIGHLLQYCYLDVVSKGDKITLQSIKLSSRKYYEQTVSLYFDKLNRYALEPFENKLDRYNQEALFNMIVKEARDTRKKIMSGDVGGNYFSGLSNPPTSHFIVTPKLGDFFTSLESNFLLSRYKSSRDKNGQQVTTYALYYGLVESERMNWGYPPGREFRNYFVQRSFDFTRAVHEYLSSNQTIKCADCGNCYPLEKKESFEMYHWKCPNCNIGECSIVYISNDFENYILKLNQDIMLEPVEIEILSILNSEKTKMRAGEISILIDSTHQMVGKRTSKLQEMGLVEKSKNKTDRNTVNKISSRAENLYF